jgi:hypothetical protein
LKVFPGKILATPDDPKPKPAFSSRFTGQKPAHFETNVLVPGALQVAAVAFIAHWGRSVEKPLIVDSIVPPSPEQVARDTQTLQGYNVSQQRTYESLANVTDTAKHLKKGIISKLGK